MQSPPLSCTSCAPWCPSVCRQYLPVVEPLVCAASYE